MIFRAYQPIEALRPYIRQFLYILAEGTTDTMAPPEDDPHFVNGLHQETQLPSIGSLIFVRGAEVQIGNLHQQGKHSIYIIGPGTEPVIITTLKGWFEGIFVEFQPGGMRALLGYDMAQLKGRVACTDDLGDQSLHELGKRIRGEMSADPCIPLLNGFFLGRLNPLYTQNEPIIQRVVDAIDHVKGAITVQEMASVACLSDRQFRRIFADYVGLSPKEFIRLRRMHLSLQYMQGLAHQGKDIDPQEVALRFGYYDLSHMASEYRQLGCSTPTQFRKMGIPLQDDFSLFFG